MWQKCERDAQNYNEKRLFLGLLINFGWPDFTNIIEGVDEIE